MRFFSDVFWRPFPSVIFALVFFLALSAEARPTDVLLQKKARPTVADILKVDPRLEGRADDVEAWDPEILKGFAQNIAHLEIAFPKGRYFSLGRDVVGFGDFLDAFYTVVAKQPGRVGRIDASTSSFYVDEGEKLDSLIVDYLAGKGLNFNRLLKDPPFIVFDYTSFRVDSQSRKLIGAAYREAERRGYDKKKLVRKLNFASFDHYGSLIPRTQIDRMFSRQAASMRKRGPSQTMGILGFNQKSSEWHDSFLQFRRTSSGRVVTQPGEAIPDYRRQIIDEHYRNIAAVQDPEFLLALKRYLEMGGRRLQDVIGKDRYKEVAATWVDADEQKQKQLLARFEKMKSLPRLPSPTPYAYRRPGGDLYSANGWAVFQWYEEAKGVIDDLDAKMVVFLLEARRKQILGGRETRRMVREILQQQDFSEKGLAILSKYFRQNPERFAYAYKHIGRAGQPIEISSVVEMLEALSLSKKCRELISSSVSRGER